MCQLYTTTKCLACFSYWQVATQHTRYSCNNSHVGPYSPHYICTHFFILAAEGIPVVIAEPLAACGGTGSSPTRCFTLALGRESVGISLTASINEFFTSLRSEVEKELDGECLTGTTNRREVTQTWDEDMYSCGLYTISCRIVILCNIYWSAS